MKRSTARWTTTLAATALLGLPLAAAAQTAPPASTQPPATSSAQPESQQGSAQDHLRQANEALNDIPAASLKGKASSKVAELKRHVSALQKSAASSTTAPASPAQSGKNSWSTQLAAADKVLNELLGPASTTGASEPTGTTGTTGTTAAKPKAAAIELDETTRTKLNEVRTHLTAFAAAMSGTAGSPSSPDPGALAASTSPSTAGGAASMTGTAATGATASPAGTAGAVGTSGTSGSATSAQPPSSTTSDQPQTGTAQVNPEEAKRHITAARDALSQMTQLPAAAQLTGDARTQVSQLISNFNELITTNAEWRASYEKVEANLTALIGAETTDEAPVPTSGTAGAVGTSGTTSGGLDPGIRAKLVEFRQHLNQFEKAAGGNAASASDDPGAAAAAPTTATSMTSAGTAGTTGSTSSTTSATGTSGTTPPQTAATAPQTAAAGHSEAMRHIAAIEAILSGKTPAAAGTSSPTSATGTSGTSPTTATTPSSLDRTQIEQIRTHLNELKKLLAASR